MKPNFFEKLKPVFPVNLNFAKMNFTGLPL